MSTNTGAGMKAVLVQTPYSKSTVHVFDHAGVGSPGENEVLIKNEYVASNPKDWKIHDRRFMNLPSFIEGNDVAGTIEAIGPKVTKFKKGDRVAGFSRMATDSKYGAYAEYTVVPSNTTFKIADSVPLDQASTLGLASMTAAIGLFVQLGLPTPQNPSKEKRAVFINGASSSVGQYAVQLAKLAGLYVIGTAGAAGESAKQVGTDVVIDYRNLSTSQLIERVQEAAEGYVFQHAYDAVSSVESMKMCCDMLPQEPSSIVTVVLLIPEDFDSGKVSINRTMVGTAHAENSDFAETYYDLIAGWVAEGKFKCNPVKLLPSGLASVCDGLEMLRLNKVSGEKLVYRVSDTPGIGSQNWH